MSRIYILGNDYTQIQICQITYAIRTLELCLKTSSPTFLEARSTMHITDYSISNISAPSKISSTVAPETTILVAWP
jgi:hypothetical protein